jgi:hypothetical protein
MHWNIYNKYLCLQNWVLVQSFFFSHIDRVKLQVTLMVVDHLASPAGAENCHIVSSKIGMGTAGCNYVWNVMAHAQKPDFVFRRNERVHLNRRGHQFSRLLAAEVCASVVVMLATPCSEVVWRVLVTHSIHQFPLHFPSRAPPCAIRFQLDSTDGRTATKNSIAGPPEGSHPQSVTVCPVTRQLTEDVVMSGRENN